MSVITVLFYLLAVDTLQGKLFLIARHAVVVGVLLHKALDADGLLATVAGEAILVPTVALMLHLFRAWWVEGAERETEKEWEEKEIVHTLTNVISQFNSAHQHAIGLQLTEAVTASKNPLSPCSFITFSSCPQL